MVQRCIVHLIRNSLKYIPSKDYKKFTAQLKRVYGAPSLKAAEAEFERLKQAWGQYPGEIDVWKRNWAHVQQLFSYGSAVLYFVKRKSLKSEKLFPVFGMGIPHNRKDHVSSGCTAV